VARGERVEDRSSEAVRGAPRGAQASARAAAPPILSLAATLVAMLCAGFVIAGLLPEPSPSPDPTVLAEGSARVAELLDVDGTVLDDIAAYRGPRRRAALVGLLLALTVPAVVAGLLVTRRGDPLLGRLGRLPGPALQVAVATSALVMLSALVRLPVTAWVGIVHEGRWGFRTRSAPGWLLDHLVTVGGRAAGIGVLAWATITLVRRRPRDWWSRLVLLVAATGPLLLLLHPVVVHPLLLPTVQLPDGPHREAVAAVMATSTVDVPVLVGRASLRTTRRNAVATGLGPTERIVLHDTLLDLDPRVVAAITAHELAHLERRDPLRAALVPVPLVALVALLAHRRLRGRSLPEPRTLVVAAAVLLSLEVLMGPARAAVIRTVEHRTDVRSVIISQDPEAHVALVRAFVVDGFADPAPPRWSVLLWATHPTPAERVAAVSGGSGPTTR